MESSSKIDKLISSIKGSLIPDSAQMKEAVGAAVDEKSEIPSDFVCNICMCLVFDPYACN
jgi:hypothetical protein